MATIGDHLRSVWKNYIAPTAEDIKVGKKEQDIVHPSNDSPENKESYLKKELSMVKCRNIALQCPLFMKGARKKSMDSIRTWFEIQSLKQDGVPIAADMKIIEDFDKRTKFFLKWLEARIASFIYGDGYLLITFENDEKTQIFDAPSKIEINDKLVTVAPWKVDVLNSEFITELDFYPTQKEKYQKLHIKHFHYVDAKSGNDYWIHPDRIIHLTENKLPHKELGNSTVNLLRNIVKSMINIDISCGEILSWFAHGYFDIADDELDDDKIKYWKKIAKEHPGVWMHKKEQVEIKAINPQAIDPKPFYDYLVLKVAAAFRMPTHVLTGIQVGRVTGAEVGMGDYVKDLKDDQDLQYTPLIESLYERILAAKGRKWKYQIVWNPIYIDELSEATIAKTRAEAATLAMNGQRGAGGFANVKEARMMYNKGQIQLDTEKIPSNIPKPQVEKPKASDDDKEDDDDGDDNNKD